MKKSNNSDKFSESIDIYNISTNNTYKQFELNNYLALTSDNNRHKTYIDSVYADLTNNDLFNFVISYYNYAKKVLPKYNSKFSKKTFNQP